MNPRPAFWGVRCLRERGVRDVKGRQTKEEGGPEKEGGCRGKSIRRRDTGMEVMPHILHILYFTHPSTQRLHASIESMHNHSDSLGHTRTRQQSCSSDRGSDTYKAYHVCRSSLGLAMCLSVQWSKRDSSQCGYSCATIQRRCAACGIQSLSIALQK